MRQTLVAIAIIFSVGVLFFACAPTLKEYQPKSPEEQEIIAFLIEFQDAWNSKDEAGVSALLHEDGKITYGRERITVSTKKYIAILPQRMKTTPTMNFKAPKIKVAGDKAVAKVSASIQNRLINFTMHMVRENNKWYLMNWTY